MSEVRMNTHIAASASAVWEILGDFNGWPRFMDAFEKSTMEGSGIGAVRTLYMKGNGLIRVERLEKFDDTGKTLSYSIITSPSPVQNYLATIEVIEIGAGQSEVRLSSTFAPKGVSESEAVTIIEGVYAKIFEGLQKFLVK
ncbi:MAG: SRPBCC family protein [Peptococcaceae bacterium]|nr:SRPBCC family protein [Peptococcaceae bacterium]